MDNKRYTSEEEKYVKTEKSDIKIFSDGNYDNHQLYSHDEDIQDTKAHFMANDSTRVADFSTSSLDRTYTNLNAEWKSDILPLGRETFTGNKGVQDIKAIMEDGQVSLIKIYEYFIPDELVDDMVVHTNNYAQILKATRTAKFNRMARWKDVSRQEMKTFFGVIMYMALNPKPSQEHYWKLDLLYYNPLMHKINMSYNRFSAILRCWQFTDVQTGVIGKRKTHKIDPLVNKVVQNFRRLYVPSDVIVVDEKRMINRCGIKIYRACTINNYTWSYKIYSGVSNQLEGLDMPGLTVIQLTAPLLDEGRVIVADDSFTSLPLAEYLKERRTDLCGKIREDRKELPEEVVKAQLRKGERILRQKDNLYTVLKWRNIRDELMISTCHEDGVSKVTVKRGDVIKPDMIIDYNEARKGIDVLNLSNFDSRLRKSLMWYKRIAIDLLFQVSIINTWCIYNEITQGSSLTILQVQEHLVRHFLGPAASTVEQLRDLKKSTSNDDGHRLQEIGRLADRRVRKRCTGCYIKLKSEGKVASRAKQVNTECKACEKAFCLECYNENHG